jgi:hypothetical protein
MRVFKRAPDHVQADARAAVASLGDLQDGAARLVRRVDEASSFLRGADREAVELDLRALADAVRRTIDPEVRREYEEAFNARRDQLWALDRIARERDRMLATLHRIVGAIEAVPSWIYQLGVLDARAKEDLVGDVDERLSRLHEQLWEPLLALQGMAMATGR